jgi:hypothetical protein
MITVENLEELTIANLFALSQEHPVELATNLDARNFKAVENKAQSFSDPVSWDALRTPIARQMADALSTKVIGGWVSAWQDLAQVKDKAQKSRLSPDALLTCTLLEHTIESTLHPYVKVLLGSELVQEIDFDVTLATQIDGLILDLLGGSLVSIRPGRCEWSGSIALQGTTLIERQLAQLDLPGRVVLKHPIVLNKDQPT